jgi:hypothetical protein
MAGAMGWQPDALRNASLAEVWACWSGHGHAAGWFKKQAETMTRERFDELRRMYPDG